MRFNRSGEELSTVASKNTTGSSSVQPDLAPVDLRVRSRREGTLESASLPIAPPTYSKSTLEMSKSSEITKQDLFSLY